MMNSDNAQEEPRSDAAAGRRRQARSSSRPRGPPSVSTPGMRSDIEGFADDEVIGKIGARRTLGGTQDVPRVVDTTAETLGLHFEHFLDSFTEDPSPSDAPASSAVTINKYYIAQIHGLCQFKLSTLYVDFTHLMDHERGILANAIQGDFYRFHPYMLRALNTLIAKYEPQY